MLAPFFSYNIGAAGGNWPQHIVDVLIGDGPADRPMLLDEVGGILLHVALVEVGFIPTYANVGPLDEFLYNNVREIIVQ